jgi:hypothetical protein
MHFFQCCIFAEMQAHFQVKKAFIRLEKVSLNNCNEVFNSLQFLHIKRQVFQQAF